MIKENLCSSGIQASRIVIQLAELSNKIVKLHKSKIYNMHILTPVLVNRKDSSSI
jgi:hypothetical protein